MCDINYASSRRTIREERKEGNMFKKFIKRIIEAGTQEEAINKVFYGENGIDRAYQQEKISWDDHQTLLALIETMA